MVSTYHVLLLIIDKIVLESVDMLSMLRTRHFVTWKPRREPRSGDNNASDLFLVSSRLYAPQLLVAVFILEDG